MKRFIVILISLIIADLGCLAQNTEGKANDRERLSVGITEPDNAGKIPSNALNMLSSRISKAVSLNGMSAAEEGAVVNIKPFISTLNKEATATAPPMITLNLQLALKLIDRFEGNSYNEIMYNFKGVGQTEEAAYTQAFKRLNPRDSKMKAFIKVGKQKIIAYYNTHCDLVLAKADGLISAHKYQQAYDLLMSVPPVSRECYDKAMLKIGEFGDKLAGEIKQPQEETPEPDRPVPPPSDVRRIELLNGLVLKYKQSRYYGESLVIEFDVLNPTGNEENIEVNGRKCTIINNQGEHIQYKSVRIAHKENWRVRYDVLPATPVEMRVIFPKVNNIRQFVLYVNGNTHKMNHLSITK